MHLKINKIYFGIYEAYLIDIDELDDRTVVGLLFPFV